ncbi:hypothetical protein AYO21_10481 [Fonsecaea monophora]|uniref:2'-phosphotransferase n=1 Tax=Fonsecaea monophora TaxID=254056 RepID=A0A177EV85_9EURO|nr:hypothetical protein AYO21_10481 [Fonsecaea monophora]KAH0843325.1 hypothetical protein FOPE_08068 [Fonsecaea pedrosoi]OAG35341.1 hypothetical protein AYO21_10481 [Fonsecaea monophora]
MSGRGRGRGRGGRGGFRHDSLPRTVLVSKALSRLLRHAAVDERIPIDSHGYVRMDHLLGWQKLRNMQPPVTFAEVVEVVKQSDKKRFAMKYVHADAEAGGGGTPTVVKAEADSKTANEPETETQRAISTFEASLASSGNDETVDTRRFFIRATQGHSMKTVEAENLLTPISLADPASIPDTVVHGTFYGAWDQILRSGGLKSMTRNHVHFATGPSLSEVLPTSSADPAIDAAVTAEDDDVNGTRDDNQDDNDSENDNNNDDDDDNTETKPAHDGEPQTKASKRQSKKANKKAQSKTLGALLGQNKVISGMRSDAQILIYVDIRKALAEAPDMKWWRSENGVILSDGLVPSSVSSVPTVPGTSTGADTSTNNNTATPQPSDTATTKTTTTTTADGEEDDTNAKAAKLVPVDYFLAAVEVKKGIGLLWEAGRGSVRDLPEPLRTRPVPRGKGAGPRGRGGERGQGKGRGRGRGRGGDIEIEGEKLDA